MAGKHAKCASCSKLALVGGTKIARFEFAALGVLKPLLGNFVNAVLKKKAVLFVSDFAG